MKRHPAIHAVAGVGSFAMAASIAAAAPPFPDLDYGGNGDGIALIAAAAVPADSGYATHAVVQADGRLVLIGSARTTTGGPQDTLQLVLARFDAQGLPDGSFGTDHDGIYRTAFFDTPGAFSTDFETDLAQTVDGKLVYTGHGSGPTLIVGRLNGDGTPDTDFSSGGCRLIGPSALVTGAVEAFFSTVLPLAGGKTLLIGTVIGPPDSGQYFSCAMRLQADGSNDTTFGVSSRTCIAPAQSPLTLAVAGRVLADGHILIAGVIIAGRQTDPELRELYQDLSVTESRHHTLFVTLASHYAPKEEVRARLKELAKEEAAIVARLPIAARMH